jgi:hypothetical protein
MKDAPRLNYTRDDLERCSDPRLVSSAWDFILCIDLAATNASGLPPSATDPWMAHISRFGHAMFHNVLGSLLKGTQDARHPLGRMGDARVVNTSPNEILGFFPFHSNLVSAAPRRRLVAPARPLPRTRTHSRTRTHAHTACRHTRGFLPDRETK